MSLASNKTVIVIAGPTAVGKTTVAIRMAEHFKTEIISADSRQCFKELNIGVARPSLQELEQVRHHFIASHSITDTINAASFEQYALNKCAELFQKKDVVVMTGGTGLYIKAFCEGLDEIPSVDPTVRDNIIQTYEKNGLAWLQQQVAEKDPGFYKSGEIQNPQRLMRALEVITSTWQSVLHFRKGKKASRDFVIIKTGLELPKEQLQHNIHTRADAMIRNGLVEEVKGLQQFRDLNALQTVGYSEIFNSLDGKISLEQAGVDIKTNTRHYAKRQMTWFKKDKEIKWFLPAEVDEMVEFVSKYE
jgi:tRNA dimethylallyltransferase